MFFFFPAHIIKAGHHGKSTLQREILNSNEYFVYGESAWGEGVYSEFRTISTQAHRESHEDIELNVNEEINNIIENTSSKNAIENLSENPVEPSKREILRPPGLYLLSIADFFYSSKTVKEVFKQTISDWHEEYFEALNKKEIWKARWINVRYTYTFLIAMWQKSPIGDLIEFVIKIAKQ